MVLHILILKKGTFPKGFAWVKTGKPFPLTTEGLENMMQYYAALIQQIRWYTVDLFPIDDLFSFVSETETDANSARIK